MTTRPDVTALELLVRVAETGSLGAAARAMSMAQPNASRSLTRLERRLDLQLLVRSTSGSRLTDQGQVVAAWARDALTALDRVALGARSLVAEQAAQLTVSASLTVAEYLAPRGLAAFRRAHPDQHVSLDVGNSGRVLDQVVAGRASLGFVESPSVPRTVTSTVVARDTLVVVVAPSHPWARRRTPLRPDDLVAADLALREAGSGTRETLERALARNGLTLGAAHLELASTAALKAAASEGETPAVLSELSVVAEVMTGQLAVVPVRDLDLTRALRAVWLPSRRPTGASADLLAIARA
ncbi:LysR family transcriptional regulator [Nocardioides sp.]|uniref:LysR family transcriptional regulator n=1 Tax=Nocardioides sp. TaxID=35761 RepID=UPI00286BCFE2|nr:LysR family transcriptional regulator [Nocardioides sp.]